MRGRSGPATVVHTGLVTFIERDIMICRRRLLAGASAAAAAPLFAGRAEALPASLFTWDNFQAAAALIANIATAVSTTFEIKHAMAAPAESTDKDVQTALALITSQPGILNDLKNFKMVVEQINQQDRLRDQISKIRAHVETIQDFVVTMKGAGRGREAFGHFISLSTEIGQLADSDFTSAAIFPAYSAAVAVQLLLAQISIAEDQGLDAEKVRVAIARHKRKIASWADDSQPTNPLSLAQSLLDEKAKLTNWVDIKHLYIPIAEAVIRLSKDIWQLSEISLVVGGVSTVGAVNIWKEERIIRTYGSTLTRPYRYNFMDNVGMYYNTTPADLAAYFPGLISNDDYESWDNVAYDGKIVLVPNKIAKIFLEKEQCVRGVFKQKWDRLVEIRQNEENYRGASSAMTDSIHSLDSIVV